MDQPERRALVLGESRLFTLPLDSPGDWSNNSPPGSPTHGVAAFDPSRRTWWLCTPSPDGYSNATRSLDVATPGAAWSAPTTSGSNYGASLIYDPLHDALIAFGMLFNGHPVNELAVTSALSPTANWTYPPWTAGLYPRVMATLAADPRRDCIWIYGGAVDYPPADPACPLQRLVRTGSSFTVQLPPIAPGPQPGARTLAGMAFDSRRDRFILIGGSNSNSVFFGNAPLPLDAWEMSPGDTIHWRKLQPAGTGPATIGVAYAVYDSISDRVVAYDAGGQDLWMLQFSGSLGVPDGHPAAAIRLSAPWPSPSRAGNARIALELARDARVTLESLDLLGRREWERDLGVIAAGKHELLLPAPGRATPGLHFVRARAGAEQAVSRWVVTR